MEQVRCRRCQKLFATTRAGAAHESARRFVSGVIGCSAPRPIARCTRRTDFPAGSERKAAKAAAAAAAQSAFSSPRPPVATQTLMYTTEKLEEMSQKIRAQKKLIRRTEELMARQQETWIHTGKSEPNCERWR